MDIGDLIVRQAIIDDVDEIFELSVFQGFGVSMGEAALAVKLRRCINDGLCVVGIINNHIVGYRCGERWSKEVFLGHLFLVKSGYRDHKIGSIVSEYYFNVLRDLGYKITLTCNSSLYPPTVGSVTDTGRRLPTELYERMGYKIIGSTDETNIFMLEL